MAYSEIEHDLDEDRIREAVRKLALRIARVEEHLGLSPLQTTASLPEPLSRRADTPLDRSLEYESAGLELRFGEFGLAWIGTGVFFLGIVFLMGYAQGFGYFRLATALGYVASVGLYLLSRVWQSSLRHLSRLSVNSSLLLLYYTTMRLGFFSPDPVIPNRYIALALLLSVVALQLWLALLRDSQFLAGMAITLGMTSALLIDRTHVGLPVVVVVSAVAVQIAIKRGWQHLITLAIVLAYTAHLMWLLSNPLVGHPAHAVADHQFNLVYLFLYATIFSWPALQRKQTQEAAYTGFLVTSNCIGFSVLAGLAVLTHFQRIYAPVYLGVGAFFLLLSAVQWLRQHRELMPAIYACFGHLSLSISIYGYTGIPAGFLWLSLQSLVVVSMALWYRSRTLVVMNSLIYVSILLVYFAFSPGSDWVNFSFALVALATARVMNWQKERLTLRTDMLRNAYLVIAFILVLYALHRAVPSRYVTLSWTVAAVVYFLLSYLLRSIRYRWMAISAMLVTVVYLFLVDLARLDSRFRAVAFLVLGLAALIVSLYYHKARGPLGGGSNESGARERSNERDDREYTEV